VKRAVVTGAAGFVGRWMCRELRAAGYRVEAWVHRPTTARLVADVVEVVDVRDAESCARLLATPPDVLIHLAAVTHVGDAEANPELARAVNVEGTRNVMAPLADSTVAVLASTCHVYGPPQTLPLLATSPVAPRSVYASTKLAAEEEALRHQPAVRIVRAFHHTGPGQSPRFALASMAAQVAAGAEVLRVGDLSVRRDYLDVRDVVRGYLAVAHGAEPGSLTLLCSGVSQPLSALVEALVGPTAVRVEVDPSRLRRHDVPDLRGDPSSAHALGWRPRVSLGQTLADMVKAGRPSS